MNEKRLRPDQRYRVVGWNRRKAHPTDRELALLTQAEGNAPSWPDETLLGLTGQILAKLTECCEGMLHTRAALIDLTIGRLNSALAQIPDVPTLQPAVRTQIIADLREAIAMLERVRGPANGSVGNAP